MKKWEKEILQKQIDNEKQVLYRLQDSYKFALEGVKEKIRVLQAKDQTQSVIYQLKYQKRIDTDSNGYIKNIVLVLVEQLH